MFNMILVFVIVLSVVFYLYYKIKQIRTELPIRKKWYKSMATVSLGALLIAFGLNQIFLFHSTITYIVAALFILYGAYTIYHYVKAAKHYQQFIDEETALNKK